MTAPESARQRFDRAVEDQWTNYGHMGWDMAPGMTQDRAVAALRSAALLCPAPAPTE